MTTHNGIENRINGNEKGQSKISCVLMGTESLLIQCAQLLMERGHFIKAIVSDESSIINWAVEQDIQNYVPNKSLLANLAKLNFDYFFSITNLRVLSNEILDLPSESAINFHDGPLPNYAGLNATSWALINQEVSHGITWHEMTPDVDAGQIFKQQMIQIEDDEIAFSLNVKCYQTAIDTFAELISDIELGTLVGQEQKSLPEQYFAKFDRPNASASINWSKSAESISALIRALDYGGYANPLNAPNFITQGGLVYVKNGVVLESRSNSEAGEILNIDKDSLTVSTSTFDVLLSGLTDAIGHPIDTLHASLAVGQKLEILDDFEVKRLSEENQAIARKESFWLKALEGTASVDLPYADKSNGGSASVYKQSIRKLPPALLDYAKENEVEAQKLGLAAMGAYLSNLSSSDNLSFNYRSSYVESLSKKEKLFFSELVPWQIVIDENASFENILGELVSQQNRLEKQKSFNRDIFLRYPNLPDQTSEITLGVSQPNNVPEMTGELSFLIDENNSCRWIFDQTIYSSDHIEQMQKQFECFMSAGFSAPHELIRKVSLLSEEEKEKLIFKWNDTAVDYDSNQTISSLFEAQAMKSPDLPALKFSDKSLTYQELNQQANQLARVLMRLKVGKESIVGVYMNRSIEMVISLLAIHKAGGAYLPLDPTYPPERIAFMVEDAACPVILTQSHLVDSVPNNNAQVLAVDASWPIIAAEADDNLLGNVDPADLSYVIYTSGSTGKPKGVMVEQRNAVNFFVGMDAVVPRFEGESPGTWLAVTSLSFDISILELFWTITRGFTVVLYADNLIKQAEEANLNSQSIQKNIDFSFYYFASDESAQGKNNKYELLIEGAKFADQNGFSAVWTPERHFHAFGGLFPNPAVTGAAVAGMTKNVDIRAGSIVLPLHDPIRVTEDWSIIDNISQGRVGISIASGWQPNDFVLKPENFDRRKELMFEQVEVVKKLWRGESVPFVGPDGKEVLTKTLPRPVQEMIPIWVTAAGNPETFRMAGESGFNLLTHLLGQSVEELSEKLAIYRKAWEDAGHPGNGHVTLMLHTLVGEDKDEVRELVREPMKDYLRSALFLVKQAAWNFPTFKQRAKEGGKSPFDMLENNELPEEDMEALLDFSFERYFETSGLFGTPETCLQMVNNLKAINVDEIACLIDFGLDSQTAIENFPNLKELRDRAFVQENDNDQSILSLINQHDVSHFQCTPSQASMLSLDPNSHETLSTLRAWLVGGEALPVQLAEQLKSLLLNGDVINMYGPTEATIWSSSVNLKQLDREVTIGTPLANQQFYVVNDDMKPVPVGVPGELLIGGNGVVRGYHNRPELTSERFIDDPFVPGDGRKVYRTGDLVRYKDNGQVEFLGRLDFQVKIRGYRIELGEIESRVNEHDAVREAVVVAKQDSTGAYRLIGYYIPKGHAKVDNANLRSYLSEILPEFMIPSVFVSMDRFPLTPNGKVNRKALPEPDQERSQAAGEYVAPRNPIEEQLAEFWSEALQIDIVGINDNFFDLGGHSLSAVQVTFRIRQVYGVDLPLQKFFMLHTMADLAEFIQEEMLSSVDEGEMSDLLAELDGLSDEEIQSLLEEAA